MADEQTLDTNPQEQRANEALAGDDLAARVQSLEEQLAAAQDQSLRMAADLQNVRRRAEKDAARLPESISLFLPGGRETGRG